MNATETKEHTVTDTTTAVIDFRIQRTEEDALDAIAKLRRLLDDAENDVRNNLRGHASVSGDTGIVAKALEVDVAVRARQLLYDLRAAS